MIILNYLFDIGLPFCELLACAGTMIITVQDHSIKQEKCYVINNKSIIKDQYL